MRPLTRVNAFFDNENVNAYVQQHDILTVTSTNRTDFDFKDIQPPGGCVGF